MMQLLLTITILLLLPSAAPDISSDRAALIRLRSALGGRVLLWNLSNPTPCSWPGVICSPENTSVIELRLPGMGLSGHLPSNTISNLINLQTLSLRYNALTGSLPLDLFSSLKSLRSLYLQHNSFSGQIPDALFSIKSLLQVNLAENNFSGSISGSFNNLTRLGTLYLNDNHFSGPIPDLNLPGLVQFNVSNNNLSGEIPKGLSGKPKSSFGGNLLCGDPLNSCTTTNGEHKKRISNGAIVGIVIGSVIAFFVILLLLLRLCKIFSRKGVRTKENDFENPMVEIAREKDGKRSKFTPAIGAKEKEKGEKKGLIFFGNMGWNFDLEELLRASAEVLGRGTFGTAYKAVLNNGLALAVKRMRDVNVGEKEFREKIEEIGRIDHENLVALRAYYYSRDEKLLVYDYLPMGSLSALLHGFGNTEFGKTALNWDTRTAIALGAAKAISHLHSQGSTVSHGNIKSSNILLTKTYQPRVSNFGLAHLAGPTAHLNCLTGYRAPEVTDTHRVSQKADVYSFGILMLELVTGKAPAHGPEEGFDLPRWVRSVVREEWTSQVFDNELLRYENVDLEEDMVRFMELAVDCTVQYPDNRPSMIEVVDKIEELCRSIPQSPSDDIANIMDS